MHPALRELSEQVKRLTAEVAELRERVEQYDHPRPYLALVTKEEPVDGRADLPAVPIRKL